MNGEARHQTVGETDKPLASDQAEGREESRTQEHEVEERMTSRLLCVSVSVTDSSGVTEEVDD